jgi:hypothetical protein
MVVAGGGLKGSCRSFGTLTLAGLRSQHGRTRRCCGAEFVPKILDLTVLQVAPWFALIRQFAAPQVGSADSRAALYRG